MESNSELSQKVFEWMVKQLLNPVTLKDVE